MYIYVDVPNLADLFSEYHFVPYQRAGHDYHVQYTVMWVPGIKLGT